MDVGRGLGSFQSDGYVEAGRVVHAASEAHAAGMEGGMLMSIPQDGCYMGADNGPGFGAAYVAMPHHQTQSPASPPHAKPIMYCHTSTLAALSALLCVPLGCHQCSGKGSCYSFLLVCGFAVN
jgi:hypothetical protein